MSNFKFDNKPTGAISRIYGTSFHITWSYFIHFHYESPTIFFQKYLSNRLWKNATDPFLSDSGLSNSFMLLKWLRILSSITPLNSKIWLVYVMFWNRPHERSTFDWCGSESSRQREMIERAHVTKPNGPAKRQINTSNAWFGSKFLF